jgi:hypothetical protein
VADAVPHGPIAKEGQKQKYREGKGAKTKNSQFPAPKHAKSVGCARNQSPLAEDLLDEKIAQEV